MVTVEIIGEMGGDLGKFGEIWKCLKGFEESIGADNCTTIRTRIQVRRNGK